MHHISIEMVQGGMALWTRLLYGRPVSQSNAAPPQLHRHLRYLNHLHYLNLLHPLITSIPSRAGEESRGRWSQRTGDRVETVAAGGRDHSMFNAML
ncbi:unnamed protein product [Boreogadus saida]